MVFPFSVFITFNMPVSSATSNNEAVKEINDAARAKRMCGSMIMIHDAGIKNEVFDI